jgi:manganese/iron transport system ATP-binding protein
MNRRANDAPAIEVTNLSVSYGERSAIEAVSFSIEPGLMVGVIGPNGAGKSTLFKALVGLVKCRSGEIRICGEQAHRARGSIAYVPQRSVVDWDYPVTVEDVVMMGRYAKLPWWRSPNQTDKKTVHEVMDILGICDLRGHPIGELSGGQQQRVFVARALAQDAKVLLLDEPLAGIDAATEKELVNVLAKIKLDGRTLLIAHHDLATAGYYFDRIILLNRKLYGYGTPRHMLRADILSEVYKGRLQLSGNPIREAAIS